MAGWAEAIVSKPATSEKTNSNVYHFVDLEINSEIFNGYDLFTHHFFPLKNSILCYSSFLMKMMKFSLIKPKSDDRLFDELHL